MAYTTHVSSLSHGPQFNLHGFPVQAKKYHMRSDNLAVQYGGAANFCQRFSGLKLWIIKSFNNIHEHKKKPEPPVNEFKSMKNEDKESASDHTETSSPLEEQVSDPLTANLGQVSIPTEAPTSLPQTRLAMSDGSRGPSLCIAVIGATGELARRKIFPALFALFVSGSLPENIAVFGYSRKSLTDEDLRSIIASTLTCRVDHQQDCGDKMEAFLKRTYYINGGDDNREGMSKLNVLMDEIEGGSEANRIFYLSVPHEALIDVATCLSDCAQTTKGWNRVIIEKPFGFNAASSNRLTLSLVSKFEENQIYRIDHLLGRNLIENLTVLRFSNLVFEPLWSHKYIKNVQIVLSEDLGAQAARYFDGYGIIRDIVHSHIFQTIALLAMEPPTSLDGEDIRNEKMEVQDKLVKVLRSMRKLGPRDVILGQYKASTSTEEKVAVYTNTLTPTYFAAAMYIDNARWDGVPFLVKTGIGLIEHRVEIRIQFRRVPGNLYREHMGHAVDSATNELILRDAPDEAILIKVNNKIPGLGLHLDSPELNLLYKDKYNVDVPDSYEQLVLDAIDGDNHLFMRSDEVSAAWNILAPVLHEIDKDNIAPELYELGGRGPIGAYYLWAEHGVRWVDD